MTEIKTIEREGKMWEKCPDNPDPHGGGGSGQKKIHEMYGNELFDKRSNGAIILTTKRF